ncbi:hypothetical protein MMC11_008334 [Xylographa trunciseda]|nr:hypothetical protein [Xylographa trunciseda]
MSAQVLYTELPGANFYRHLELHAGSRSTLDLVLSNIKDPLRGTLFQLASIDKPSTYDALSYRWSEVDPRHPVSIEIDGVPLSIGSDLHVALLQFRSTNLPRLLWIDQICINQADEEEKIHQIRIMGDIYSKAQTVLIWLGDSSDQSDVAMEFFPIFVDKVRQDDERSRLQQSCQPPSDVIEWGGTLATHLGKLFLRPWFGRVWTLQEAALGQKAEFWCGQKSFPFQTLETFERGCYGDRYGHWASALALIGSGSRRSDPENPDRSLIAHIHVVSTLRDGSGISSARILNTLRKLDCSEHQDRIYSVLRFLDSRLVKEIVEKRMPSPAELYHLVAMHGIQRGELEYLGAAGLSQHRMSYPTNDDDSSRPRLSLPSWVPDWTYTIRTHSYWVLNSDCQRKRGRPLYTAGRFRSAEFSWSFSDDPPTLYGSGVVIDEVNECTAPFHVPRLPKVQEDQRTKATTVLTAVRDLQSYIASCTELATKCTTRYGSSNVERACRHSLVGSMMPDGSGTSMTGVIVRASDEAVDSLFEGFQTQVSVVEEMEWFTRRVESGPPFSQDDYDRMVRSTAAAKSLGSFSKKNTLMQAMAEACKGRRFFITGGKRYMGVAPDITRPGDRICIIPGYCAPFVIRPKRKHYQLIGECYIAGVMDGELMEEDISIETIVFE